ncbi:hypothetical protein [Paraprevotella clara]|uniref:hypothetical protein n=1 Tax=Paraprevotella clara TaxID=454154 RepID=UPI002492B261|nr:hypothetical protein [Paraprevotella clara]
MEKKITGASLAQSKKNAQLCGALHISTGVEMSANNELRAFFMPKAYRIGSVPCGRLMPPLPQSRCNATGSGTFSVSRSGTFKSVMIMTKSNGSFARDMNVVSRMQNHLAEWFGSENVLVSSLIEERVSDLQKVGPEFCGFKKNAQLCGALHFAWRRIRQQAVGLFCAEAAHDMVPTPVLSLNGPTARHGVEQRESGTFFVSFPFMSNFKCSALCKM